MQKYWNKMKSLSKCRAGLVEGNKFPRLKAEKWSRLRQLQRYILFNLRITRLTLMVKDILKHVGKNIH